MGLPSAASLKLYGKAILRNKGSAKFLKLSST
jgi:hypothetical protein